MHARSVALGIGVWMAMLAGGPGLSQEAEPAIDCVRQGSTLEQRYCAGRDYDAADTELNAAYGKLSQRLEAGELNRLKVAQRAWIAFRDAECAFQTQWAEGGTLQPLLVSICLTDLTQQRLKQLEYYLDCGEGDLTCPPHP